MLFPLFRFSPICWFLLLCLYSGWTQAAENEHGNTLGFWQSIEPFGAELPDNRQQQAFYEIGRYFELMDFWRRAMYAPHAEKPLWTQFRKDIQHYDQEEFFSRSAPYFSVAPSGLTSLIFSGDWQHKAPAEPYFDFAILNPQQDSETRKNHNDPMVTDFGDLQGNITFLPGTNNSDTVLADLNIALNLGSLLFSEILGSIETMNRAFEADRLAEYQLAYDTADSDDDTDVEMSSLDKALLTHFFVTLPNSMKTLSGISRFEKLVTLDTTPSGKQVTRINHRQRIDPKALKQNYSDTYDDFDDLLNGVSFVSEIRTGENRVLARFAYDAQEKLFSADMGFADGGFVLMDSSGKLLDQIIFPTQLATLDYVIANTMRVSLFGLKVAINNFTIDAHYDAGLGTPGIDRQAEISMAMNKMPAIDVSGAFLYLIPTWLIDLFIPGTIETLIADSIEDLVSGNNGKGLLLLLNMDEHNNQHTLKLGVKAELPYEVIQELVKIEDNKENEQQSRLYRIMRADLRRDFAEKAVLFKDPRLETYLDKLLSR